MDASGNIYLAGQTHNRRRWGRVTVGSAGTTTSGPSFPPPQVTTSQRTLPANVNGYPAYSAQAQIQIDGVLQANPFYDGGSWQCTRYAWGRAVEKIGVTLAFAGGPGNQNGGQWYGNALSKAFQKYLQNVALDRGWTMDGTADLCRLLRLPGTYNRKQAEPVLVRCEVIGDGRRYNPSDFEDFLNVEADPELKAHATAMALSEV